MIKGKWVSLNNTVVQFWRHDIIYMPSLPVFPVSNMYRSLHVKLYTFFSFLSFLCLSFFLYWGSRSHICATDISSHWLQSDPWHNGPEGTRYGGICCPLRSFPTLHCIHQWPIETCYSRTGRYSKVGLFSSSEITDNNIYSVYWPVLFYSYRYLQYSFLSDES